MPEPSILFTVTGVVIAGLVAWVGVVLARAHQPWARAAVSSPMAVLPPDAPLVTESEIPATPREAFEDEKLEDEKVDEEKKNEA